jgi:pimeloyl-ACP methyl ester carboxylesterase
MVSTWLRRITPDFGHSDTTDAKSFEYTFDKIASVTEHFTDALDLSRYTLYMQDYGGPVGFGIALAHRSALKQPRLLVNWGKYDLSEPQAYRRDLPNAQVHVLDAGHFALDTAADEIAALVRDFVGSSR